MLTLVDDELSTQLFLVGRSRRGRAISLCIDTTYANPPHRQVDNVDDVRM